MPDEQGPGSGEPVEHGGGEAARGATEGLAHAPIAAVPADAPQLQVASRDPVRSARKVAVAFVVGILGFAGFGAAYWQNAHNYFLGGTLAIGMLGVGFGLVAWGKELMPKGPFSEERHPAEPTPEERQRFLQDFGGRGRVAIERRGFLGWLLGAAAGLLGIVAAFPLIRSLGPLPKLSLYTTKWRKGSYVVTADGRRVKVSDVEVGGILTVFPEGDEGSAISQTVLLRVANTNTVTRPGRETWGPQGYLAFSKVCTHAGCPVGLYMEVTQQLLCPCHQSLFDVLDGCEPVFGPAPRPLPQLPLYIDDEGYLRAQAGYDEPIGPGFWERGND
jgi:ubiquinol-cytochrome c reductase iron-sulfur subunit